MKILLTLKELAEMGIGSKTKIYSLIKSNQFPKPIKYGRHNRWAREDVLAWVDAQNPNHRLTVAE